MFYQVFKIVFFINTITFDFDRQYDDVIDTFIFFLS